MIKGRTRGGRKTSGDFDHTCNKGTRFASTESRTQASIGQFYCPLRPHWLYDQVPQGYPYVCILQHWVRVMQNTMTELWTHYQQIADHFKSLRLLMHIMHKLVKKIFVSRWRWTYSIQLRGRWAYWREVDVISQLVSIRSDRWQWLLFPSGSGAW